MRRMIKKEKGEREWGQREGKQQKMEVSMGRESAKHLRWEQRGKAGCPLFRDFHGNPLVPSDTITNAEDLASMAPHSWNQLE